MNKSPNQDIRFEAVEEDRGSYFVTYQPPMPNCPFATLCLTFAKLLKKNKITSLMESEAEIWLKRYPVPLMVSSFDPKSDLIEINADGNHLVSWIDPRTNQITRSWKLKDLTKFCEVHPNQQNWAEIYQDIPYRTQADIKAKSDLNVKKKRMQKRSLKIIIFLWVIIIPAAWVIVQFFAPAWLAIIVTIYGLWKISQEALRLSGYKKPSLAEKEKSEKERKKDHYYYHCEQNPEGFERLKGENFDEDSQKQILAEQERIKSQNAINDGGRSE